MIRKDEIKKAIEVNARRKKTENENSVDVKVEIRPDFTVEEETEWIENEGDLPLNSQGPIATEADNGTRKATLKNNFLTMDKKFNIFAAFHKGEKLSDIAKINKVDVAAVHYILKQIEKIQLNLQPFSRHRPSATKSTSEIDQKPQIAISDRVIQDGTEINSETATEEPTVKTEPTEEIDMVPLENSEVLNPPDPVLNEKICELPQRLSCYHDSHQASKNRGRSLYCCAYCRKACCSHHRVWLCFRCYFLIKPLFLIHEVLRSALPNYENM